jgi:hypothetical protein
LDLGLPTTVPARSPPPPLHAPRRHHCRLPAARSAKPDLASTHSPPPGKLDPASTCSPSLDPPPGKLDPTSTREPPLDPRLSEREKRESTPDLASPPLDPASRARHCWGSWIQPPRTPRRRGSRIQPPHASRRPIRRRGSRIQPPHASHHLIRAPSEREKRESMPDLASPPPDPASLCTSPLDPRS